ncbi:MAG: DISARM system phospholipase D-like protein DrmC, partial [Nannocystaceae bacterium]
MGSLQDLGRVQLLDLAHALGSGRLRPPYSTTAVGRVASGTAREIAAGELRGLAARGLGPEQIAVALELLAQERLATQALRDSVELVWTDPPEQRGRGSRRTSAVVRSLFESAEHSVIVASFVLDGGRKGRALLGPLRRRMQERPELQVRLLLNVTRTWVNKRVDTRADAVLLQEFAARFRELWPQEPRPAVFYDPRALSTEHGPRACLHAKCVVVDGARALVTSANFTEAAHERNVEAGVLVSDAGFVQALRERLDGLVRDGAVRA